MQSRMTWAFAALTIFATTAANAGIILSDEFDTVGGTVLNWDGGANWTVQNGTVDLVRNGDYGIECLGNTGHCVDLDGSTGKAGEIMSGNLGPLGPGDYTFSYWLSGNQRNGAQLDIAVALTFGSTGTFAQQIHLLFGSDGWQKYTHTFTLYGVTDPVYVDFSNIGGDNVGVVLDNVMLVVSEPATFTLLGFGLAAFAGIRRRRTA